MTTTSTGVEYTHQEVKARLDKYGRDALRPLNGIERAVFWIGPGDRAWNPVNTGRFLTTPKVARLTYTRYTDGGITAHLSPL
jgi:hypothetical protein